MYVEKGIGPVALILCQLLRTGFEERVKYLDTVKDDFFDL